MMDKYDYSRFEGFEAGRGRRGARVQAILTDQLYTCWIYIYVYVRGLWLDKWHKNRGRVTSSYPRQRVRKRWRLETARLRSDSVVS